MKVNLRWSIVAHQKNMWSRVHVWFRETNNHEASGHSTPHHVRISPHHLYLSWAQVTVNVTKVTQSNKVDVCIPVYNGHTQWSKCWKHSHISWLHCARPAQKWCSSHFGFVWQRGFLPQWQRKGPGLHAVSCVQRYTCLHSSEPPLPIHHSIAVYRTESSPICMCHICYIHYIAVQASNAE